MKFLGKKTDYIIEDDDLSALTLPVGSNGLSAYELAVQEGFSGTLEEWLLSLYGQDGTDGNDGSTGAPGYSPVKGVDYFDGDKGDKGDKGDQGDPANITAHELAYTHANIATAYDHSQSAHLQFSGLAKITVGTVQPTNPATGDLWIETS